METSKILSIDIGGSAIKYALIDIDGNIEIKGNFTIDNDDINTLLMGIDNLISKYNHIKGIAISSPGTIDKINKTISGSVAVPCIKTCNWVKIIEEKHNLKCSIENDANCATLAELWIGSAKEYNDFINIVIGTGIGSTLVIDRKIHYGKNEYGAELGYLVYKNGANLVYESEITSTKALVDRVKKVYDVENGIDVMNNLHIQEVKEVFDEYVYDLSLFIYNVVHMYDPEIVLIGGAISSNKLVIEGIKQNYEVIRNKVNMSDIDLNLNTCHFHNDSNLIGAVYNFLNSK